MFTVLHALHIQCSHGHSAKFEQKFCNLTIRIVGLKCIRKPPFLGDFQVGIKINPKRHIFCSVHLQNTRNKCCCLHLSIYVFQDVKDCLIRSFQSAQQVILVHLIIGTTIMVT